MLDPIPSKLLKEVLPEVIDPVLAIINSSLSLGYVPKNFKLAVIKPLIKKTQLDPKDLVNYRPISNLPFLSKILEKVVSSQLYSFLEKNYICEDFQSGFRPNHSTETAFIRVTNDLLLSSDRGCISLLVLLDLSAAFDTFDHNILLNRLENFVGISGSALAWFKSYLQCPPLILAPLVNMTKGGCENKSALFILFIFHSKNSQNSNLSLK